MAAFNKFQPFVADIANKIHNLGADVLKVALSNSAPSASFGQFSQITEIAAGSGYSAGGATVTITSSTQSGGTYKLILVDVVITASGGSIGPFQYVVLYNSTPTNKNLIGWYDYGSAATITSGNTLTVDFDGVNGVLQLA
jgi:hypothetical protein